MLWQVRRGLITGRGALDAAASSLDAATTAWVAAVVTAGGTVSAGRQTIVDTFIKALKAASLFTVLDRYWLLAGEDAGSAKVDMISLQSWTPHGTFTHSPSNGYTGDGSSGYGDTGYIPSSGGGHLTQDSATVGVQIQIDRAGTDNYAFGADDAGALTKIIGFIPKDAGPNINSRVNSTAGSGTTGPASVRHSWLTTRTGASTNAVYADGTVFYSPNDTSVGLPTTSLFFGALHYNNAPFGYSTDQMSSFYFGGGMNSTQVTAFEAAQNAMMTSIGINVH